MGFEIRKHVTASEDGKLEIEVPGLKAGQGAKVTLEIDEEVGQKRRLTDFLGTGKGTWKSKEDADAYLQAERDSWS